MSTADRVILVFDEQAERAQQLKDLIEFMDAPRVQIVSPDDWRDGLADLRIAAVFVNGSLDEVRVTNLIREIGRMDPNVPIVVVDADEVENGEG